MNVSNLIIGKYEKCSSPVLSVLIPTYREHNYLFQAIDSILSQDAVVEYEVVVVSNDPEDSLDDVIARYKENGRLFLYQNRANIGMAGNHNQCVKLARGKYIAFLHDDDYLLGNYLAVVKKYVLERDDVLCLITGRILDYTGLVPKSELIKKYIRKIYFFPDLYRAELKKVYPSDSLRACANIYFSPSCGTVFLRKAFLNIGGFDETIKYSFDYDFFLRFNVIYDIYETSEICAVYRIDNNASKRNDVKYEFFDYYRTKYLNFFEKNNIEIEFLHNHKKDFLYSVYKQLGPGLEEELIKRGESVEEIGKVRWILYRIMTSLYYYNHNLDIQRLKE